jgi:TIR domain/FHA domain
LSGTDIFLSYARHDRPAARIFAESFQEEGFSVWWDASLHSGETFDEVIEQRLRDAKAVVVLWSPRSVASRWVRAEATLADRRNKLVPAIIEPCDRPIIFELTHAAELADWHGDRTDARWQAFVEDLRRLVQKGHEQEAATGQSPAQPANVPPSRRQAASRLPLRPGSDEVISAGRVHQPVEPQPSREPVTADAHAWSEAHCLEIEGAELPNDLFVVISSGAKVGRSAPADIVLAHKSVSREHCIIGLANDELLVTDLNSTNGTYIDEVRISRATILPVGSVLRLGQLSLRHSVRSQAEAEQCTGLSANADGGLTGQRVAVSS